MLLASGVAERPNGAPWRPVGPRSPPVSPIGARAVARTRQTAPMSSRDPLTVVLVLLVYVLPLGAAAALLWAVGLPWLAVALLAVEAVVAAAVVVAKRPARVGPRAPRPGWVVPAAMVGVLVALLGVTLVAARLG